MLIQILNDKFITSYAEIPSVGGIKSSYRPYAATISSHTYNPSTGILTISSNTQSGWTLYLEGNPGSETQAITIKVWVALGADVIDLSDL